MNRFLAALLLAAGFASVASADELDGWANQTAALKAEDQLTAVRDKLRELNKDFGSKQGEISGKVVGGVVRELAFDASYLADIRPVRVFRDLEHLHCVPAYDRYSKVADIACLKEMKLKSLNLERTSVADLSPLDGMPLERVKLGATKVKSLKPLHKAPLTAIHLPLRVTGDDPKTKRPANLYMPAADAMFLADKKLTYFVADHFDENTGNPNVSKDLALILKGSKDSLQFVLITGCAMTDLKFLEGTPVRDVDLRWCPSISSLEGLGKCQKLENLSLQQVKGPLDLAPLKGKPLTGLMLYECPGVGDKDLVALGEMPTLKHLGLSATAVGNLKGIERFKNLEALYAEKLGLASLKPLAGLPGLKRLDMRELRVADGDFNPLARVPLETISIDADKNEKPTNPALVKALKSSQTLKSVNGKPAAEVLK